jgi:hypothetical protein
MPVDWPGPRELYNTRFPVSFNQYIRFILLLSFAKEIVVMSEVGSDRASRGPAKAPGDEASFKAWLKHISQAIAEASAEGGLLGFGGVRVSDAEKATLAQISASLGLAG